MLEEKINEMFELVAKSADELKGRFMKDICDKYVLVFAQDTKGSHAYIGHAVAMDGSNGLHLFGTIMQLAPRYQSSVAFPEFVIPGKSIQEVYVMKTLKSNIIDGQKASEGLLPASAAPSTN